MSMQTFLLEEIDLSFLGTTIVPSNDPEEKVFIQHTFPHDHVEDENNNRHVFSLREDGRKTPSGFGITLEQKRMFDFSFYIGERGRFYLRDESGQVIEGDCELEKYSLKNGKITYFGRIFNPLVHYPRTEEAVAEKLIKKVINCCSDCYFFSYHNSAECSVQSETFTEEEEELLNEKTPDWCPLNIKNFVITKETF